MAARHEIVGPAIVGFQFVNTEMSLERKSFWHAIIIH
jgi:hypothetical protein